MLDQLAIRKIERQQNLPRLLLHPDITASEKHRHDVRVLLTVDVGQESLFAGEQLSAPNAQHGDAGVVAIARVTDDVTVSALDFQDDRRLFHRLQMVQHVAELSGSLEVELFRCQVHSLPHSAHDFVGSAGKEQHYFVDHRAVVMLRLGENAGRLTAFDVVIEARSLGHLCRHVVVAASHGEDLLHHIERAPHRADIGVGTEITGPIVFQPPRHENPRKRLLNRDLDVGIRLVIAQRDVEAGLVLLYEIRFENERVGLGGNDDRLEVADQSDQVPGLYALELVVGEVAAHPRAQALRFSYVKGRTVPALPQINAGSIGKVWQFCGDSIGHGQHV